jgi:hypothetical protein
MLTPRNRRRVSLAAAASALLIVSLERALPAQPNPEVGLPSAEPAQIVVAQPTRVRFSADISDSRVIAGSVSLERVVLPGTTPTVVGTLHDDGLSGDAVPGDGRYSIEVVLNEPSATRVTYRISAGFTGLQRVSSRDILVTVAGDATGLLPTSRALIQVAVQAGRIDYGTSLLYRAYAAVEDPRLPEDLRGSGSAGEDHALWVEIEAIIGSLPQELRELLRPFTLRPAHPDSNFNTVPLSRAGGDSVPADTTTTGVTAATCPAPRIPVEPVSRRTWVSVKTAFPVRIWFSCTGNTVDDGAVAIEADRMVEVINQIWTPMVKLMGEPILDAGGPEEGGDGSIDIYLVDTVATITPPGRDLSIFDAPYFTRASPPRVGLASSAYIVLSRRIVESPSFHSLVIHEFFHVLQFAHNIYGLTWTDLSGEKLDYYWFGEASAVWAGVYFDRTIPWPTREAKAILKSEFDGFQKSHQSLHVPIPSMHAYEAFIWPFFMEQETDEKSIARAWMALEGVTSWETANTALDQVFPFATNFHNFAVRNINDDFLPALPEERRYVKLDALFPDRQLPDRDPPQALVAGQPVRTAVSLGSLTARYFQYDAEDPQIQQVIVDLSALSPAVDLDIDALLNIVDRGWVLRNYTGKKTLTFCFNNPDEHLRDVWLILSNHSTGLTDKVQGDLVVTPLKTPCGCGRAMEVTKWRATLKFEFIAREEGDPPGYFTGAIASIKRIGHATFDAEAQFPNPVQTLSYGPLHGTFTVSDRNDLFYAPNRDKDQHFALDGSGPPAHPTVGAISLDGVPPFDSSTCTYSFRLNVAIETTEVSNLEPPRTTSYDVATLAVVALPVTAGEPRPGKPIVLAGSTSIPVHPYLNGVETNLDVYGLSALMGSIQTGDGQPDAALIGNATVDWEFTQIEPPPFVP